MRPILRGGVFTRYGPGICPNTQLRPYQVSATPTLFFYYVRQGPVVWGVCGRRGPHPQLRPYRASGAGRKSPTAYLVFTYRKIVYLFWRVLRGVFAHRPTAGILGVGMRFQSRERKAGTPEKIRKIPIISPRYRATACKNPKSLFPIGDPSRSIGL